MEHGRGGCSRGVFDWCRWRLHSNVDNGHNVGKTPPRYSDRQPSQPDLTCTPLLGGNGAHWAAGGSVAKNWAWSLPPCRGVGCARTDGCTGDRGPGTLFILDGPRWPRVARIARTAAHSPHGLDARGPRGRNAANRRDEVDCAARRTTWAQKLSCVSEATSSLAQSADLGFQPRQLFRPACRPVVDRPPQNKNPPSAKTRRVQTGPFGPTEAQQSYDLHTRAVRSAQEICAAG